MTIQSQQIDDATSPLTPSETRRSRRSRLPRGWKFWVGISICLAFCLIAIFGPLFAPHANQSSAIGLTPPSLQHLFGTTSIGQDVFAQMLIGTQGSVLIGFVAGILTVVISMFMGIVGAFLGGVWDEFFSLISNVFLVIPGIPLLVIITDYVDSKGPLVIALVIALTGWAGAARVLRALTLSVRSRDYVDASRVAGEGLWRIILGEVLPNLMPVIASQFVFGALGAILAEAGLAFLGLGASDSTSWGSILFYAQNANAISLDAWWWFVPPGLCIALLGAALALINFSIDEKMNPKLRSVVFLTQRRHPRSAR